MSEHVHRPQFSHLMLDRSRLLPAKAVYHKIPPGGRESWCAVFRKEALTPGSKKSASYSCKQYGCARAQAFAERHLAPAIHIYNSEISRAEEDGQWHEVLRLKKEMEVKGVSPTQETYHMAISACESDGQGFLAFQLAQEMEAKGFSISEGIYTLAISACEQGGNAAFALKLFDQMQASSVSIGLSVYNLMLSCLIKGAQWNQAIDIFLAMCSRSCKKDLNTYKLVLTASAKATNGVQVLQLLQDMTSNCISVTEDICKLAVEVHASHADWHLVPSLLHACLSRSSDLDVNICREVLASIPIEHSVAALRVFRTMQREGFELTMADWTVAMRAAAFERQLNVVRRMLQEMRACNLHTGQSIYRAILGVLADNQDLGGIECLLKLMADGMQQADLETYQGVLLRLADFLNLDPVLRLFEFMDDACVHLDSSTFQALLLKFAACGQADDVLRLLEESSKRLVAMSSATYLEVLAKSVEGKHWQQLFCVSEYIGVHDIVLNHAIYNMVFGAGAELSKLEGVPVCKAKLHTRSVAANAIVTACRNDFNRAICTCAAYGRVDQVLLLLCATHASKICVAASTYHEAFDALAGENHWGSIWVFKHMRRQGITFNAATYAVAIRACTENQQWTCVKWLSRDMHWSQVAHGPAIIIGSTLIKRRRLSLQ